MKNLYEQQKQIGENLLSFIRLKGYSKSSFAKMVNISRPTLDQILEGKSPNAKKYEEQLQKITDILSLPIGYFMAPVNMTAEPWQQTNMYYSDRLQDEQRTEQTKELLADLDDLLATASFFIK